MTDTHHDSATLRTKLTPAEVDDIASTVAGHWSKKIPSTRSSAGAKSVPSYSYDDMYQDAALHALTHQHRWDPNKSDLTLVRYCYIAAEREIRHLATRAMAAASSRGRSSTQGGKRRCLTTELGATRKVSLTQSRDGNEHSDTKLFGSVDGVAELEACQMRELFLRRASALLGQDDAAMRVLPAVCGLCEPRDLVRDDFTIRTVYSATQRARRQLKADPVLRRALAELNDKWPAKRKTSRTSPSAQPS